MNKTLKEIIKNVKDSAAIDNNTKPYDTTATVIRVEGETAWVHIPGGVEETPVAKAINCTPGDVVRVRVSDGKAWITGNDSAPPTDDTAANKAKVKADTAQTKANAASAAASTAQSSADTAAQAAATAQSTADAAKASASSAANAASAAQTKANEASEAAATAQSKADSAGTAASKAQSSANAAGEAASSAQAAAEAAQAAADGAQADIDSQKEYFWHDANGAHVLGSKTAATRYRTDIDSEGMHIKDVSGEVQEVAKFTASGAQIGKDGNRQAIIDEDGLHVSNGGKSYFHAGYSSDAIDAEGKTTTAPFYTEGRRKSGSGIGSYSHAEGLDVTASGYSSHAEGNNTTASGGYSHAEGQANIASNSYSHAEGRGTTASGYSSHAEGYNAKASGNYSHAQNKNTIAAYDAQTAIGKYNSNSEENALEIGNGTGTTDRSNAFAVDWYGNVTAKGKIADGAGNIRDAIRSLYYTAGDTISFGNIYVTGTITGSKKGIYFTLPISKPIIGISACTITWWNGKARQNGSYLFGSGSAMVDMKNLGSVEVVDSNYNNALTIKVTLNTAITSATNNDAIALNMQGGILLS